MTATWHLCTCCGTSNRLGQSCFAEAQGLCRGWRALAEPVSNLAKRFYFWRTRYKIVPVQLVKVLQSQLSICMLINTYSIAVTPAGYGSLQFANIFHMLFTCPRACAGADSIIAHACIYFQLYNIFTCLCILGGFCMHLSIGTEPHTHCLCIAMIFPPPLNTRLLQWNGQICHSLQQSFQ